MSVWLWTYVVTKALPEMYTSMGYGVYIFFATMLVFAAIYAFFFIKETKGKRIAEMDQLFGFVRAGTNYAKEIEAVDKEQATAKIEDV